MPHANRCFLPNHIWHITHRCHKKYFLLKFVRDRRRGLYWLSEARCRFGLCVLDYTVTSNHIHLLVRDQGRGEIARGMQLGRILPPGQTVLIRRFNFLREFSRSYKAHFEP